MVRANVKGELVKWAVERRNITPDALAQKLGVTPSKVEAWESGEAKPTFRQAQELAQKLNVPFGYLFLSEPPVEEIPLPDLRTITGARQQAPSPEFIDVVNDALRKQEWFKEYREADGTESVPFIGRYSLADGPEQIAGDITATLGIDQHMRVQAGNWEQFLTEFVRRAEATGVIVLRNGVVGNNTHRPLNVSEFRGFAISDPLAPLVFINAQDAKTAQIFTLAHELAHLWLGASGISNPDYSRRIGEQPVDIDALCDKVAAETLLPRDEFLAGWNEHDGIPINLQSLATQFRVSKLVVLRRAYDTGSITRDEYRDYYADLVASIPRSSSQGGGDFYRTLLSRNSNTLTRTIISSVAAGGVPIRDAARLLNLKIGTFMNVRERLLSETTSA
jgi:Zn-dependent peptidase ImmA (M78 family)/DNA-binding XRE family transcriptional regulator